MDHITSNQEKQTQSAIVPPTGHLVTGLYWNKSRWNGGKTEPVVLELTKDTLTMYDRADKQVFNVPLTAVQARFTRADGVYLTINSVQYWLTGMGTPLAPGFSASQKERLQEFNNSVKLLRGAVGASAAGVAAGALNNQAVGAAGDVAGAAMGIVALHGDDKLMNRWYTALQQAGVQVTGKRGNMMLYVFIMLGLLLAFFIYLAITHPASH